MSCCSTILDLADTIWNDLGQPTGQPPAYIATRLVSAPYIGKLNNLLATCYSGVSGCIEPTLGADEQGVYEALYVAQYYTTKLNQTLQGIGGGAAITLADGDSRIVLTSPVDVARMYRDAKKEAVNDLLDQVNYWKSKNTVPYSRDFPTIINSWFGGGGYGYGGSVYNNPHNYYRS